MICICVPHRGRWLPWVLKTWRSEAMSCSARNDSIWPRRPGEGGFFQSGFQVAMLAGTGETFVTLTNTHNPSAAKAASS